MPLFSTPFAQLDLIRQPDQTNDPLQAFDAADEYLLNHLHERCTPHSTDAEKNFQRLVRELNPSAHLRLNHSPCFEDDNLELTIRFADQAALRRHWPTLCALSDQLK